MRPEILEVAAQVAKHHQRGSSVDVQFTDGWHTGYVVDDWFPDLDVPYRVTVTGNGKTLVRCHPDCIRAALAHLKENTP